MVAGTSICEFTSWSTSKRQRGDTGDGASLLKPQSYPSDTFPAVSYFPVFPKELHQLGPSSQTPPQTLYQVILSIVSVTLQEDSGRQRTNI